MLIDNKERTIKLIIENFVNGNLSFNNNEIKISPKIPYTFSDDLNVWLKESKKDFLSEDMKKYTVELFERILELRVRNYVIGILKDTDLEEKNKILSSKNTTLKIKNDELKIDNINAIRELKDKTELLNEYEKSIGINKK